jgi:hypothetical protein
MTEIATRRLQSHRLAGNPLDAAGRFLERPVELEWEGPPAA